MPWFPHPGSWLKAFALAASAWLGATAAFSLAVWHFLFLAVLAVGISSFQTAGFLAGYSAGLLLASLGWHLLLVLLYKLFLKLLWKKTPRLLAWIEPPRTWRSLFLGWAICTVASLAMMPFFETEYYDNRWLIQRIGFKALFTEDLIWRMFFCWYVAAAYLYQLKYLISKPK